MDHHSDFIDIGSSRLGYRVAGDGPDLFFVHGWPLNRETWRNVVTALPDFRCHLVDLPGSGRTITPQGTAVSLRGHVDAVTAAIDVLGLGDVVLVGHDSGGLIARFVAEKRIDRTPALVLAGTEIPHHHPVQIDRLQMMTKLPGSVRITQRLINTPVIARSNQFLGSCFHDRVLIEGEFRTEVLDPNFRDKAVVARQLEMLHTYTTDFVDEVEATHANLTCPTLLVWGEADPYFPVTRAREMAEQFAGSTRFEVIEDARLLVHEEHPERFAELVRDFVNGAGDPAEGRTD
ncbi:MAG: alpha/beta fold hydrolase [Acidimicrobiales bacterium]